MTDQENHETVLFIDGYAILDPETYRDYLSESYDDPYENQNEYGHASNHGSASEWAASLALSELLPGEPEPPGWPVEWFGEHGCVLAEWRSGMRDSAWDLSLFPYSEDDYEDEYGEAYDELWGELVQKTNATLMQSIGVDEELFRMGLHPLTKLSRSWLNRYIREELVDLGTDYPPEHLTIPDKWVTYIADERYPEDRHRELVSQVVRALLWGRAHARRLKALNSATMTNSKIDSVNTPAAAKVASDSLTLGQMVEFGLVFEQVVIEVLGTNDFVGADLAGRRLGYLNFTDCDLRGANSTGCDLRGNRFTGADLRGAVFDRCTFGDEPFGRARIAGASFRGANFEETWTFDPSWEGCAESPPDFDNAQLGNIDFTEATE